MKISMVLNGGNLWRFPPALPEQLRTVAAEAGHTAEVHVSRSPQHAMQLIGQAVEAGAEALFAGGGDGTLHHVVNHPEIYRVTLAPLPMGTVNAFLRAEQVDVSNPVTALRQLLSRPIRECHCGLFHDVRFACFASLGYDARVVHGNSRRVKRYLRRYSYVATGMLELLRPGRAVAGRVAIDGATARPASSAIYSRICNYAGRPCFSVGLGNDWMEAVLTEGDTIPSVAALLTYLGGCGPARGKPAPSRVVHCPRLATSEWTFERQPVVQLDGEESRLDLPATFQVRLDPRGQRFFVRG